MSEATKKCPYCNESINLMAKKCKHCEEWLEENNQDLEKEPITKQPTVNYTEGCAPKHKNNFTFDYEISVLINGILLLGVLLLIKTNNTTLVGVCLIFVILNNIAMAFRGFNENRSLLTKASLVVGIILLIYVFLI